MESSATAQARVNCSNFSSSLHRVGARDFADLFLFLNVLFFLLFSPAMTNAWTILQSLKVSLGNSLSNAILEYISSLLSLSSMITISLRSKSAFPFHPIQWCATLSAVVRSSASRCKYPLAFLELEEVVHHPTRLVYEILIDTPQIQTMGLQSLIANLDWSAPL